MKRYVSLNGVHLLLVREIVVFATIDDSLKINGKYLVFTNDGLVALVCSLTCTKTNSRSATELVLF